MNVSTVTAVSGQSNLGGGFRQRVQELQHLRSALQTGNGGPAPVAFASPQKNLQSSANPGPEGGVPDPSTVVGKDFHAMEAALQSGDLKAARLAFETLKKDLQNSLPLHHPPPSEDAHEMAEKRARQEQDAAADKKSAADNPPLLNVIA